MGRKRQLVVPTRRMPTQERAKDSVEAILAAAAQILAAEGVTGLNTNRIAERAGVSIGTLYQYFDGKVAIVLALARRILSQDRASVMAVLAKALAGPTPELDRAAIRETVRLYQDRPRVRRAVMETMIGLGLADEVGSTVQDVGALLAGRTDLGGAGDPSWSMRLFVVTRAVEAVIRGAAYGATPFFDSPEFEDVLVQMTRAVLPELRPLGSQRGA